MEAVKNTENVVCPSTNKMEEKEYRESYELKRKLHGLIKEIILKTDLGNIDEFGVGGGGIEELNLDFAGGSIYSCIYYEQVTFVNQEGEEDEIDDDSEYIKNIVVELEKRLKEIRNNLDKKKFKEILNKKFNPNIF